MDLLEVACPGKAIRFMAADLVAWHPAGGGDVDPNTAVWAALLPAMGCAGRQRGLHPCRRRGGLP